VGIAFVDAAPFTRDLSSGQISELRVHLHRQIVEFQQVGEIGSFLCLPFGNVPSHVFGANHHFLGLSGFVGVVDHPLHLSIHDVGGFVEFFAQLFPKRHQV
jgi:hypothetical protein